MSKEEAAKLALLEDGVAKSVRLMDFNLNKLDRILEWGSNTTIIFKGSNEIGLKVGTTYFAPDADITISTATDLDIGTISNGKDYSVYACNNAGTLIFKISLASTYPAGYTADNSRKIGGFHTLSVAVGTISGHTLTGYLANDILPQSVWDLKHRPRSNPAGMVFSPGTQKWVDIYLASGTGANTASAYGGTISDTRDWMSFVDDGQAVSKRLLSDFEFQSIASGSNEETNITGSADPVTTGGHVDTAARRMISNIGCEDCCGAMWQWLIDQSFQCNPDGTVIAAAQTLTITHVAAPEGNPIYLKYSTAGVPYLCCNMATDAVDKIITFGSTYTVRILHDAAAASGGLQVYFDEDATQPARLLCALPGLKTEYLRTNNPNFWLPITYNAAPATPGVAIKFDDATHERLEFISPTTTNGTLDTALNSQAWANYDLPGAHGSLYRQGTYGDVKLLAGGYWNHGANSGSRSRHASNYRWSTYANVGARLLAEPL
jgi:hypothetical protein